MSGDTRFAGLRLELNRLYRKKTAPSNEGAAFLLFVSTRAICSDQFGNNLR